MAWRLDPYIFRRGRSDCTSCPWSAQFSGGGRGRTAVLCRSVVVVIVAVEFAGSVLYYACMWVSVREIQAQVTVLSGTPGKTSPSDVEFRQIS